MIYYSYEIGLQSFWILPQSNGKIVCYGEDMAGILIQVWFFGGYFFSPKNMIYYSYEIGLQSFRTLCQSDGKLVCYGENMTDNLI